MFPSSVIPLPTGNFTQVLFNVEFDMLAEGVKAAKVEGGSPSLENSSKEPGSIVLTKELLQALSSNVPLSLSK